MAREHNGRGRSSDYRKLLAAARKAGWTISRTGSGHVRCQPPQGRPIIISFSPGTSGVKKTTAQFRRAGLNV